MGAILHKSTDIAAVVTGKTGPADQDVRRQLAQKVIGHFPRGKKVFSPGLVIGAVAAKTVFVVRVFDPAAEPNTVVALIVRAKHKLAGTGQLGHGRDLVADARKIVIFHKRAPVIAALASLREDRVVLIVPGVVNVLQVNDDIVGIFKLRVHVAHIADRVLQAVHDLDRGRRNIHALGHVGRRHFLLRNAVKVAGGLGRDRAERL